MIAVITQKENQIQWVFMPGQVHFGDKTVDSVPG